MYDGGHRMPKLKESAYVNYLLKILKQHNAEAVQLQTQRTFSGAYIKKEPVDLMIAFPGKPVIRIEVKRSENDNGNFFRWANLKQHQVLAIAELQKKGHIVYLLVCWSKSEYSLIKPVNLGELRNKDNKKLHKIDCEVLSVSNLVERLKG